MQPELLSYLLRRFYNSKLMHHTLRILRQIAINIIRERNSVEALCGWSCCYFFYINT